jgi:hypothetical protein
MRKILVAFAVLGMFAMVANAGDITLYFGAPEYYTGTDTTTFVADSYAATTADYADGPVTLGIWANVDYDAVAGALDIWQAIGIDIVGANVDSLQMDNFDHRVGIGTAYRWEASSDFGTGNHFALIGVTTYGVGGLFPADLTGGVQGITDWWSYTALSGGVGDPDGIYKYWLGNVTLSATEETDVYMQIASQGVVRRLGSAADDLVWFGEDETTAMTGDMFGEHSVMPDFVFTPEPASLILLSLAGLFLRRR